ncbi:hypothetical protein I4U23_027203 [Adineta vaga]|nr:hypothetical protein I4U23_027203 [Adineta vaga]
MPNTHRIHTLRIANHFIFDDQTLALSQKTFLQKLILEKIETEYLKNVLDQLTSLLHLSSLTITTIEAVDKKISIYQKIFSLPSLKYCKVSMGIWYTEVMSPCTMNNFSPIEHLIINDVIEWRELNSFLSYVPHLRRLKLNLSQIYDKAITNQRHNIRNNLTHVSLDLTSSMDFIGLEEFFSNHFPFVQVLHILLSHIKYMLKANEYQRLVSSYLPNLSIFDVVYLASLRNDAKKTQFEERKDYEVCNQLNQIFYANDSQNILKSVNRLWIENEVVIEKCNVYFSNVTELTLENEFVLTTCQSFPINLIHILPLQRLQTLRIQCNHLCLSKMIEILSYTTTLHTLVLQTNPFTKNKI